MKPKTNRKTDKNKVQGMDVCATPPHALEPLLPYLGKDRIIWESATGPERLLEKALYFHGYQVYGSDLCNGEVYNFFSYEPSLWDVQVTNLPFSVKYAWIERSFELQKPFALIVPFETLAAGKFHKLLKRFDVRVTVLAPERRINYKMPEKGWGKLEWDEKKQKMVMKGVSAQMPTCWLTWKLIDASYKSPISIIPVPMRLVRYDENNQPIEKGKKND